jgi:membrane protein required for colicin V production
LNFIDIVVLVVIAISALIALSSGFVNVVLWIASWVVAVVATVYFFPTFQPIAAQHIPDTLIANIVTAVAIFLVALIICTVINQIISRIVRGSAISALDRSLGLVFGLVIGAVIVCGAYMLLVYFVHDEKDWPEPVKQARTLPLVQRGAAIIQSMVPESVIERGTAALDQGMRTIEGGKAASDGASKLAPPGTTPGESPDPTLTPMTPAPETAPNPAPSPGGGGTQGSNANPQGNPDGQQAATGYKDAQRNDLNRLIESSQ